VRKTARGRGPWAIILPRGGEAPTETSGPDEVSSGLGPVRGTIGDVGMPVDVVGGNVGEWEGVGGGGFCREGVRGADEAV